MLAALSQVIDNFHERGSDQDRMFGQLGRVRDLMRDGGWRTLQEIQDALGPPDTLPAISARLRDFRKAKFGGHAVKEKE